MLKQIVVLLLTKTSMLSTYQLFRVSFVYYKNEFIKQSAGDTGLI